MKEEELYIPKIGIETIKILGQSMYSDIKHAIGEIIANSHDAGAKNIWINYNNNEISIEDDGTGMSQNELRDDFLYIGNNNKKIRHENTMGRKGIGKLASLFVAPYVNIFTKKDNITNGFIMSLNTDKIVKLTNGSEGFRGIEKNILSNEQFKNNNGTKIVMKDIYQKDFNKDNLISGIKDVFEGTDSKVFKIYFNDELIDLSPRIQTENIMKVIIIGKFDRSLLKIDDESKILEIQSPDFGINYRQSINGWIAIYESLSKNIMKKSGFTNWKFNSIKIFSRGKLGQSDILNDPDISKNRIGDRYISGYIYADVFEEGDIDMALPNRQGYNSSDERYITAKEKISEWVTQLVNERASIRSKEKSKQLKKEREENIESNRKIIDEFGSKLKFSKNKSEFEKILKLETEKLSKNLKLNIAKKSLLISHKEPNKSDEDDDLRKNLVFILLIFKKFKFIDIETLDEEGVGNAIIISSMDDYSPSEGDFWKWIYKSMIENANNRPGVLLNIFTKDSIKSFSMGIESGMAYAASLHNQVMIGGNIEKDLHKHVPGIMKENPNQIIPNLSNFILNDNRDENKICAIFLSLLKEFEINSERETMIKYMNEVKSEIQDKSEWIELKRQYFRTKINK